jgi:acetylornithine deacetylase/succinyl-diaminopimelate desuccinylase-like protein
LNPSAVAEIVERVWADALPALCEYIRIPARSPAFEPGWARQPHMNDAVRLAADWCRAHAPSGLRVDTLRLPGRTPLLLLEMPGTSPATALAYGHLDKQPEFGGWSDGLGPWQPVLRGERLYGRGGADDGYAVFAVVAALRALAAQGAARPRVVALIECSEESGSPDLPPYLEALAARIGTPDLVVALDSGCGDYERLWSTTSLRGLANAVLEVDILRAGVHSGDAGGIVPDSFRIARALLARVEDPNTGRVLLREAQAPIPAHARAQIEDAARILGAGAWERYPWVSGAGPATRDGAALLRARAWESALAVTGAGGLPPTADAGNVLRAGTALKLSLRLAPTVAAPAAAAALERALTHAVPSGAHARVRFEQVSTGWAAPELAPWLREALAAASCAHLGAPPAFLGEGVTIPFMAMLGERFPRAQFLVTGVLGPESNAHGPDEFLHLGAARRLSACIAHALAACAAA